jgi:hypothetical protein
VANVGRTEGFEPAACEDVLDDQMMLKDNLTDIKLRFSRNAITNEPVQKVFESTPPDRYQDVCEHSATSAYRLVEK